MRNVNEEEQMQEKTARVVVTGHDGKVLTLMMFNDTVRSIVNAEEGHLKRALLSTGVLVDKGDIVYTVKKL